MGNVKTFSFEVVGKRLSAEDSVFHIKETL